jgi:hypothetical protein
VPHDAARRSPPVQITSPETGPDASLVRCFPKQADEILRGPFALAAGDRDDSDFFRVLSEEDLADGAKGGGGALLARFPRRAENAVHFQLPDGFAFEVQEANVDGRARQAQHAVAYDGHSGTSYWAATAGGYEEWLLVNQAHDGEVASWITRGAALRQAGNDVEIMDESGHVRLRVAAPHAYLEGGEPIAVRLALNGNRIALMADLPPGVGDQAMLLDPTWTISGDMINSRSLHTATRLLDGRVLVAGGGGGGGATAEIYDPATRTWSAAANMLAAVHQHAATLLRDGRVLLTNGKPEGLPDASLATIYDPKSNTWVMADPSRSLLPGGQSAAVGSKSVTLPDGRVLLTGTYCCPGNEAQIYDPKTDRMIPIASMLSPRRWHTLTLLLDGSVLAVGGPNPNSNTAELYVPDQSGGQPDYLHGTWMRVGDMSAGHYDHMATLLTVGPDAGKVMVCGGLDGATFPGQYIFTSICELYNPQTRTFAPTGSLQRPFQLSGTYNGGNVDAAIARGPMAGYVVRAGGWPYTNTAEIYNPFTRTWSRLCDLPEPRLRHTTTPLPDGSILMTGGMSYPSDPAINYRTARVLRLELPDMDCDGTTDAIDDCPSGNCGTVSGTVFADLNNNCSADASEPGIGRRLVRADNGRDRYYALSERNGSYRFRLPSGRWNIRLVTDASTTPSPACGEQSSYQINVTSNSNTSQTNFFTAPFCAGTAGIVASPPPVEPSPCPSRPNYVTPCPGIPWRYEATFTNKSNGLNWLTRDSVVPGTKFYIELDACMSLAGTPVAINCKVSEPRQTDPEHPGRWEFELEEDLAPGEENACKILADVTVNCIPPSGPWRSTATLQAQCMPPYPPPPEASMEVPHLNACSCDPNDMQVSPVGCGVGGFIDPQELTYTVQFQNKGSGPAHNVVIRNDLDPDLDIETFRLLGSSHPITDLRILPSGALMISFDGIELPAESQDPIGSQGYVQFAVSPIAQVSLGAEITNAADIYFDQNLPVRTNTVRNTIGPCAGNGICLPPPAGLVAWYPGNVDGRDVVGGNDLMSSGISIAVGQVDNGFLFLDRNALGGSTATMQAADVPSLNFDALTSFTFEFWLRYTGTPQTCGGGTANRYITLMEKRDHMPNGTVAGYSLFLDCGKLGFQLAPLGANFHNYVSDGPDLRDGAFHHLAIVVDRTSRTGSHIYVDGAAVPVQGRTGLDATGVGSLVNSHSLMIGAPIRSTDASPFKGVLDEISIYERALSAPEIDALYRAEKDGKCNP